MDSPKSTIQLALSHQVSVSIALLPLSYFLSLASVSIPLPIPWLIRFRHSSTLVVVPLVNSHNL